MSPYNTLQLVVCVSKVSAKRTFNQCRQHELHSIWSLTAPPSHSGHNWLGDNHNATSPSLPLGECSVLMCLMD